jgi:ABC-type multidrug transport system ATPase subunit
MQVWALIRQLGLGKVAHSLIGDAFVRGLSGGEKRRVSIAVELLTRPGLLLLDEPTTGLDSTNAARVVDIMAALARAGVTVVMSIHQPRPDIFRLMDRVLLLSGNGEVSVVL